MRHCKINILLPLILLCFLLSACGQAPTDPTTEGEAAFETPALNLTITADPEAEYSCLMEENTETSFTAISLRSGIAEANITIDGESLPLADALTQGLITQEEIFCYARKDARSGFCEEEHQTKNGLTHFTYHYPDYNLRVVYDVYETPDGGTDLINHVAIYPNRENYLWGAYRDFYDPVTGKRTDLEDWGLTFTVLEATAHTITIECQQSGGQQIGQLSVDWYTLSNESGFLQNLDGTGEAPSCETVLNMNGKTVFTLDWTDVHGALPSGEYSIGLNVFDHFDETTVHPLMKDYHDWQAYDLTFSIP